MTSSTVRRASAAVLGVLLAVGGTALAAPAAAAPPEKVAVIVQLTPGSDAAAESRRAAANGGSVSHVYEHAFKGFAGDFTPQAIAALERNPRVAKVEADGVATTTETITQAGAVWGLDRLDETNRVPLDGDFAYPATGTGVTAYVIDTGIAAHTEFENRLKPGRSFIKDKYGTSDCDGHGTHVAGTIGSKTYGVAKNVSLVPVRVLDCRGSGSWSGVISGIDWVIGQHQAQLTPAPSVANLSLGGPVNTLVDAAVVRLVGAGVTTAVAAGNSNADASKYSPARVGEAITVAATDSLDARATFSNFGTVVDIHAPGVGIKSTWLRQGTNSISGTSMASPHVAGAAAVLLSQAPGLTPAAVADELDRVAAKGVVTGTNVATATTTGSPNELLHVTTYLADLSTRKL